MDHSILDPDSAKERLREWKDRIDKLAADTRTMSERLQGVRATATDPSGLVEVTIDSTGSLVDLKLTSKMQSTKPDVVAQTIMQTLAEAKNQLADQSQQIIAETVGTDSPAARAIAESVGNQLRSEPVQKTDSAETDHEDDDYENRSFLKKD
ncbi:YbaB/EbfC family nucleoid-associated protein [Saccharomonospora glauca]|jgi:DNA-binding protein YbaB|uniref:YbaB/EbfC DNA-binding family protein n=1 Tax=Saccharomonospora glauca K62 TaxID=928724 RepID=I1D6D4_9PSEU|nr:YbaB/EbfC family nucleoid-associated protein [Saccharomonospora glauca]EIF00509.1 hypothetical protein SacglDRAFT_03656 [Saccharomonospora glauca K62]